MNTVFRLVDGLEVLDVPDGYVVYDHANDKVHYLNPTAAAFVAFCDGKKTVAELSACVAGAFDLTEPVPLEGFAADLETAGIICPAA